MTMPSDVFVRADGSGVQHYYADLTIHSYIHRRETWLRLCDVTYWVAVCTNPLFDVVTCMQCLAKGPGE